MFRIFEFYSKVPHEGDLPTYSVIADKVSVAKKRIQEAMDEEEVDFKYFSVRMMDVKEVNNV